MAAETLAGIVNSLTPEQQASVRELGEFLQGRSPCSLFLNLRFVLE